MILTWFKSLSFWQQATVFLACILFVVYQTMSIRYEYIRHQWIKSLSEEKNIIEEKQEANESFQDDKIDKGINTNKKVQSDIKKYREKARQDAKDIDNTDYSNIQLDSLLSSYGN